MLQTLELHERDGWRRVRRLQSLQDPARLQQRLYVSNNSDYIFLFTKNPQIFVQKFANL